MKRWTGFLATLAMAIILAVMATTPPGPVAENAPQSDFSAKRAMADVERIAASPHATGTAENAVVRAYLVERLRSMGLEVREVSLPLPPRSIERMRGWSKGAHVPTTMVNVIGVLPGKHRGLPAVALMAHHDTVWGSPGAADDTAGVATILESVRAIKARGMAERDLAVIITDAEELGLSGAEAFFASDPLRDRIGMVVNMEARGGGGRTTLFETSPDNGNAMVLYADAVSHPGASSLAAFIYSVLPNDTDLSVSLRADKPGYNFAFIGRSGLYHSPKATPANLDQGALQDMGGQVLALTDRLLRERALPAPAPSVVFFDAYGLFLVTYPTWVGWLMLGAIVLGLGLAARAGPGRQVAEGLGRMLILIFGTAVTLFVFNLVSGAGSGANYYDRLAAIPKLEAMALLTCAGMSLLLFRTNQITARVVGAALPLLVLGAAAQCLCTHGSLCDPCTALAADAGDQPAGQHREVRDRNSGCTGARLRTLPRPFRHAGSGAGHAIRCRAPARAGSNRDAACVAGHGEKARAPDRNLSAGWWPAGGFVGALRSAARYGRRLFDRQGGTRHSDYQAVTAMP
ncbi:M20/M25/M40 family metallo-hydrolase [Novosphingobium sp. MW5]|nr:M20/M25/M40 family metallo-hydrolase [Novosphingobium sp. MW5]